MGENLNTGEGPRLHTSGLVFSEEDSKLLRQAVEAVNNRSGETKYTIQTGNESFSAETPVVITEEGQQVVKLERLDGEVDMEEVWNQYQSLKNNPEEPK